MVGEMMVVVAATQNSLVDERKFVFSARFQVSKVETQS